MRVDEFNTDGMETVTSLFLLIVSALLIFSVLSQVDPRTDNEDPLFELRTYQVRSMGEALITFTNDLKEPTSYKNRSGSDHETAFYWDGASFHDLRSWNFSGSEKVQRVMETTPDGLSSYLLIGGKDVVVSGIIGEYITWHHMMPDGSVITLFLSLHVGSMEIEGWGG